MTAPAEVRADAPSTSERRLTIHEIAADIQALDELLEETEGEITEEIETWLTENGEALSQKTDGIGRYLRSLEARAAAADGERKAIMADAERLTTRARVANNKARSFKGLCERVMLRIGREKWEGEVFTLSRQKNGGKRSLEYLVPAELLPAHLTSTIPAQIVAVEDAVRTAFKAGAGDDFITELHEDGSSTLFVADAVVEGEMQPVARLAGPTYSVRLK